MIKKVRYRWHTTSHEWEEGEIVEEQPARVLIKIEGGSKHWFFRDLIKLICENE